MRNPAFNGRERELELLASAIVAKPGVAVIRGAAGSGKTALACEFANRFARSFDGVFWINAGDRPLVELAGEVGAQMGHRMEGDAESVVYELGAIFEWKRYLLIVDHVLGKLPLAFGGNSSTLVLTRKPRLMPSAPCARLAEPASLDQHISAIAAAMAVCAPGGFPLSLAAEIAGVELDGVPGPAQPLDPEGFCCMIPQYVVDQTNLTDELRLRHAEAAIRQPVTADVLADLYLAFRRMLPRPDHWDLVCELARHIITFTQGEGRLAEAFAVMEDLGAEAEKREDYRTLNRYSRERVWMLHHWGRDTEAKTMERRARRWQAVQMPLPWDEGWK